MSEVFTQTLILPAERAAVSPAATATVNLYSLLISTPLPLSFLLRGVCMDWGCGCQPGKS